MKIKKLGKLNEAQIKKLQDREDDKKINIYNWDDEEEFEVEFEVDIKEDLEEQE